jgi:WD40 repeat protein
MAFAPDGRMAALAGKGRLTGSTGGTTGWLQLWALGDTGLTAQAAFEWEGVYPATVAFSPDGSMLAAGLEPRIPYLDLHRLAEQVLASDPSPAAYVQLWKVEGQSLTALTVLEGDGHSVRQTVFAPDSRSLAVDDDKAIRLWDLGPVLGRERLTARCFELLGLSFVCVFLLFLVHFVRPRDRSIGPVDGWFRVLVGAAYRRGGVSSWCGVPMTMAGGALNVRWRARTWVRVAASLLALVAIVSLIVCFCLRLWSHRFVTLAGHTKDVTALAFSPDGHTLASGSQDHTVRLWEVGPAGNTQRAVLEGHTGTVNALAFSPDGKTLVSGGGVGEDRQPDWTVRLWDIDGRVGRERAVLRGPQGAVQALAFAPDGQTLFSAGDDPLLRRWDLGGPVPFERSPPGGDGTNAWAVAFSPDGATLAVGERDNRIRLWDLAGPAPRARGVVQGNGVSRSEPVFSGDGRTLAVACGEETVCLWRVNGGGPGARTVLKGVPRANRNGIQRLAFSPDGRTLAVGGSRLAKRKTALTSSWVQLWDLSGRDPHEGLSLEEKGEGVTALGFAPDGKTLAVADTCEATRGTRVRLWDLTVATPRERTQFSERMWFVSALWFFPDGQTLALRGIDLPRMGLHLWKVSPGKPEQFANYSDWDDQVCAARPVSDGRAFLVAALPFPPGGPGSREGRVVAMDAADGARLHEWRLCGNPQALALAPDGRHVATANGDGTVSLLRLWGESTSDRLLAHCDTALGRDPHCAEALIGRGKAYLEQTGYAGGAPGRFKEVRRLLGLEGGATATAWLPDGGRALSAGSDGTLRVWDLATGWELQRLRGPAKGPTRALTVSRDGRRALTGGNDHVLHLWDLQAGMGTPPSVSWAGGVGLVAEPGGQGRFAALAALLPEEIRPVRRFEGHTAAVHGAALSADGKRAVSASADGTARVWDVDTGKQQAVFRGHRGQVRCVALSPDGQLAVSGGEDGVVRLWDPASGEEHRALTGHAGAVRCLALASDGRRLLSAGQDGTVRLWDAGTGRELRRFAGHAGPVTSVAVSADVRLALSGGDEGTLRLWDTATGEAVAACRGHQGAVTGLAFAPDARQALSASADGSVRVWRLPLTRDQAIADLTAALALDPKSVPALALRATCYWGSGRHAEARADAEAALRLDPSCQEAHLVRGLFEAEAGNHGRAIEDFSAVLRADPKEARALYHRGLSYTEVREYARAKADLDEAIRLDPRLGREAEEAR